MASLSQGKGDKEGKMNKTDYFLNCLTYIVLIGMALVLLTHFSLIVWYGEFLIQEQNPILLTSEIVMLVAILGFGVWRFVKVIKGIR